MEKTELLDPKLMDKIGQLRLMSRKVFTGRMKGERRSKKRGQSVEFADYRNYSAGDDLRHLDWNVYGRLERLFIKLFMEEEDLTVYLFVDTSESMAGGSPSKFDYARKIAAALSYIGLLNMDRVCIGTFSGSLGEVFEPSRGRKFIWRMLDFLSALKPGGMTHMAEAARKFTFKYKRRGIVILISDFLDKRGYEEPLKYFLARNLDIYAIHVLSSEELSPTLTGDLKLVDCEDGETSEITVSAALMKYYKKNLENFIGSINEYCTSRGIIYSLSPTDMPIEDLLLSFFRMKGLVR